MQPKRGGRAAYLYNLELRNEICVRQTLAEYRENGYSDGSRAIWELYDFHQKSRIPDSCVIYPIKYTLMPSGLIAQPLRYLGKAVNHIASASAIGSVSPRRPNPSNQAVQSRPVRAKLRRLSRLSAFCDIQTQYHNPSSHHATRAHHSEHRDSGHSPISSRANG